ncbi:MAG: hypothetical protein GOVbin707_29 [Prokaryotic dsDNA virus sp.]|nr:MAG: hypothetical protein GOVbin707_29 [Prokaryotic dsDNA virus sp.]|tara:strand:- start:2623 stop:5094 length:2472 start_codon:yes stop_codon:yes gene_type:complete
MPFQNNVVAGASGASSGGGADFYEHQIANSCRFNRADGSYLSRTIQSGGNLRKWTLSFWFKLTASSGFDSNQYYLMTSKLSSSYDSLIFDIDSNSLFYYQVAGKYLQPNGAFRDTSAWGHLVIVYDSDNGTADDRRIMYFNGTRMTINDSQSLSQNTDSKFNSNSVHYIGARQDNNASYYGDYYLADVIWSDGYAYAPTQFGEEKNGCWIAKEFSGSYGTTGYHLKFESSSDLGNDSSGNNNDWTVNNISTHDQMTDTCTFNSDSNGGNFPTYNPLLKKPNGVALSEGNLKASLTTDDCGIMTNWQVPLTGKWYWEVDVDNIASDHGVYIGVMPANTDLSINQEQNDLGLVYYSINGNSILKGTRSSYGATYTTGDIISIAVDRDADTLQFYKNGSGQGTIDISSLDEEFFCYMGYTGGSGPCSTILNFGQDGTFAGNVTAGGNSDDTGYGNFKYSVPSGFLAICAGNQPIADAIDPAQTDDNYPQKLFGAKTYTGTGSSNAISGLGFRADLIWIKERGGANDHKLTDSTRGVTKSLESNTTGVEATDTNGLTAFGADGFTVGSDAVYNNSSDTYVSWNWRANGGTTSTNTQGDIDSTVQVDPSGCFSIVKYTGTLSSSGVQTVGHGLSKAPSYRITKGIEKTGNWWVFSDGQTSWNYGLNLNSTGASTDKSGNGSMSAPTSTVFSTNYTDGLNDSTGNDMIAYCFANCEGYIKSGTYLGNDQSSDGTFVYTGFRPAFVMGKGVVSGAAWWIQDNATSPYNPSSGVLEPNSSGATYTSANPNLHFLSNGFKVVNNNSMFNNTSYDPYVYLAMSHNPFKYALSR